MNPDWFLVGAVPPVVFFVGGIWGWLASIHKSLLEIRTELILLRGLNHPPVIKDRTP